MTCADIQKFCDQYGYECSSDFGIVTVKTQFEYWKFEESSNPKAKVKLLHRGRMGEDYHLQFRRSISPSDLVLYIHQHETAKFVHFVKYAMSKDGERLNQKKGKKKR